MMNTFTVYLKAHVAQLYALVVSVLTVIQSSGHIDRASLVQMALMILSAVGVYAARNTAGAVRKYTKAITFFVGAGLSAGAPFIIAGHITYAQVTVVFVALAGAWHVFITGNSSVPAQSGAASGALVKPIVSTSPSSIKPVDVQPPISAPVTVVPSGGPPATVAAPSVSPAVAAAQTAEPPAAVV